MGFWKRTVSLALVVGFLWTIVSSQTKPRQASDPELAKKIRRFSPTILTANTARLSANDRRALMKIIEAAKLMDPFSCARSGAAMKRSNKSSKLIRASPAGSACTIF